MKKVDVDLMRIRKGMGAMVWRGMGNLSKNWTAPKDAPAPVS